MAGPHLFVDESKKRGYLFAVAAVHIGDVQRERALMRSFLLHGQSHLHFTKESDGRRRTILHELIKHSTARSTVIAVTARVSDVEARRACLAATATIAVERRADRLVFERDDSTHQADRRFLFPKLRDTEVRYDFMGKREEPLLWMADAIAWCHAAGGRWRALASPLIVENHSV